MNNNRNTPNQNLQDNKDPFVSIIIAAYNEQQNIETCIKSLEKQDYPSNRIEIIVVDDESIDKTVEIARKYNVRVLNQKHSGQGAARNKGVDEASAEIVAFIDADDIASPSWLRELVPLLNDDEVAAVGCSRDLINRDNDFIKIAWLERDFRHHYSPEKTTHLGGSGLIYKKTVFQEIGGFEPIFSPAEDMELSTRLAKHGYTSKLLKKPLISVKLRTDVLKYMLSQVIKIGHMVMIAFKPRSTRRIASSYSGLNDYIQGLLPILCVGSLLFLPFIQIYQFLIGLALALLILLTLNIKFAFFLNSSRNRADLSRFWPAVFIFYLIIRSISWGAGLIYGLWLVVLYKSRGHLIFVIMAI